MNRNEFNRLVVLGTLAISALPVKATAIKKQSKWLESSRIPIGVCDHALRALKPSAEELIDYAIAQKLDAILLNTLHPFKSLETAHLKKLNNKAVKYGISIQVGVGSISKNSGTFSKSHKNPQELLRQGIRVASLLGSPTVGCHIGGSKNRYQQGGIEAHCEAVIEVMTSMGDEAKAAGIKFAFENHAGDLRSSELLYIVHQTGTDICGVLYDPANAVWALEDPMDALVVLAKHIVCTSIRDIEVWSTTDGAAYQFKRPGEGMMDYQVYVKTLAKYAPGVPLHVETISNVTIPVPYLTPHFWQGFSKLKASEMLGFLKLVQAGKEQVLLKPAEGKSQREFDIELQKSELQKSFEYLRANCDAGVKV